MNSKALFLATVLVVQLPAWAQSVPVHIKLASIDAGRLVPEQSLEAQRAKAAYERARTTCLAPNGLENQAVYLRAELMKRNVAASSVEILEGFASVMDGADKTPECTSLVKMYVSIRLSGDRRLNTHSDAVAAMRTLAKAGAFGAEVK